MHNIVIIGMPGSGKSTFGRRLAKHQGMSFVDTDVLIEKQFGCSLQTVLNRRGLNYIRALEAETVCNLASENCVIATGGSVVYSDQAMRHLKSIGTIVYLEITLRTILQRVKNVNARGLVKLPASTLQNLFFERRPLYEHWAELSVKNDRPLTAWHFDHVLVELQNHLAGEGN